jgi:hypothetical protein
MVPAKGIEPLLSAILVTTGPVLGLRTDRLTCAGGADAGSGLRRCTWEATKTSR